MTRGLTPIYVLRHPRGTDEFSQAEDGCWWVRRSLAKRLGFRDILERQPPGWVRITDEGWELPKGAFKSARGRARLPKTDVATA